jgi:hypothetical protein
MGRRIGAYVAGAALVLYGVIVAGDVGTGEEARSRPASAPGMKAYVDPATGELLPGRPANLPPEPPSAALGASTAGLVEVPTAGGGTMIDLQGRFQSPLVATIAPDGTLRVRHAD